MNSKIFIVAGIGVAVLQLTAYGMYVAYLRKRLKESDTSDDYETAYSYEEAVEKAKEKAAAGEKDARVKLIPTVTWSDLKSGNVSYNAIASEYDTSSDESIPDDWWVDAFGKDEDGDNVVISSDEYITDYATLSGFKSEEAVKETAIYIPMHDEDVGKFYRISEDTYRFENITEHGKANGIYNAKGHVLMLDKLGMYAPDTELFRRVATIVDEDEEDYADALYFTNPSDNLDVKVQIDLN